MEIPYHMEIFHCNTSQSAVKWGREEKGRKKQQEDLAVSLI